MPELPEVEVTRLGIQPYIEGRSVTGVKIVDGRLRWPVPKSLPKVLIGQYLERIERRGKYLLLKMDSGLFINSSGNDWGIASPTNDRAS